MDENATETEAVTEETVEEVLARDADFARLVHLASVQNSVYGTLLDEILSLTHRVIELEKIAARYKGGKK